MRRNLSALLVIALLALGCPLAVAQGPVEYPSTTTITGATGSINGDINVGISITYT